MPFEETFEINKHITLKLEVGYSDIDLHVCINGHIEDINNLSQNEISILKKYLFSAINEKDHGIKNISLYLFEKLIEKLLESEVKDFLEVIKEDRQYFEDIISYYRNQRIVVKLLLTDLFNNKDSRFSFYEKNSFRLVQTFMACSNLNNPKEKDLFLHIITENLTGNNLDFVTDFVNKKLHRVLSKQELQILFNDPRNLFEKNLLKAVIKFPYIRADCVFDIYIKIEDPIALHILNKFLYNFIHQDLDIETYFKETNIQKEKIVELLNLNQVQKNLHFDKQIGEKSDLRMKILRKSCENLNEYFFQLLALAFEHSGPKVINFLLQLLIKGMHWEYAEYYIDILININKNYPDLLKKEFLKEIEKTNFITQDYSLLLEFAYFHLLKNEEFWELIDSSIEFVQEIKELTGFEIIPVSSTDEFRGGCHLHALIEGRVIKELYIWGDDHKPVITSIPESIKNLKSLEILSISDTLLANLPEGIKYLKKLKELHLFGNFELTIFPEIICDIKSLEILSINYSNILTLPKTISKLKYLKKLDLAKNKIRSIPETIGELKCLQILDLSHNDLKTLPESIVSLNSLLELNLECNYTEGNYNMTYPKALNSLRQKGVHIRDRKNIYRVG